MFPSLALIFALAPLAARAQGTNSLENSQVASVTAVAPPVINAQPVSALSTDELSARIADAKKLLKANAASTSLDSVTLAMLDAQTAQFQLLNLTKEVYLQRGAEAIAQTSLGHTARVSIERANGVNTAVTVYDTTLNRQLLPLVVQYPIERQGKLSEMAYYTSAHPALLSSSLVSEGKSYVRTLLDNAADNLRSEGVEISPEIVDIAEHLCIVEHTDHKRFVAEDRGALFQEILSLYALNQPDTFRYSISTAGAGGMVQMIPQTYQMVRAQHPNVPLEADFVTGMRNHSNALTAMLLYMQDTWNGLAKSEDVQDALRSGLATQAELVSAGYNSNPVRLPLYLRRGGSEWRSLIPAETQMYLAIYGSLDHLIPLGERTSNQAGSTVGKGSSAIVAARQNLSLMNFRSSISKLMPVLLSEQILESSSLLLRSVP
ncbi:MAG: hypothetical protein AUG51_18965 [Acidobacteria bacterium 13_1_20CM_3_53_8]|nr:MAG: hypothetical protein AUG51_18965 [Acidobacteria bacterium 13_1_20CM_3_53_8]